MQDVVVVNLGAIKSSIHIKDRLLQKTGKLMKEAGLFGKTLLITDKGIPESIIKTVKIGLQKSSFYPFVYKIGHGEGAKTLTTALKIYKFLMKNRFERFCPIIAVGGGVVGDMAGFISATYKRGMPLIQIPTTLLAQVDAAIGGKVAVNYGRLKNIIGTFYQPTLVIIDTHILKTLPFRELINGVFEVIKYGAIKDAKLFYFVKKNLDNILSSINHVVRRCCQIKAKVVQQDERDFGVRMLLNFGHTIGHAVESLSGYKLSHGESIGIGMLTETMVACRLGIATKHVFEQIKNVVFRCLGKMDTNIKLVLGILANHKQILEFVQADKKTKAGKIRFALCCDIGNGIIKEEVPSTVVTDSIKSFMQCLLDYKLCNPQA